MAKNKNVKKMMKNKPHERHHIVCSSSTDKTHAHTLRCMTPTRGTQITITPTHTWKRTWTSALDFQHTHTQTLNTTNQMTRYVNACDTHNSTRQFKSFNTTLELETLKKFKVLQQMRHCEIDELKMRIQKHLEQEFEMEKKPEHSWKRTQKWRSQTHRQLENKHTETLNNHNTAHTWTPHTDAQHTPQTRCEHATKRAADTPDTPQHTHRHTHEHTQHTPHNTHHAPLPFEQRRSRKKNKGV